MTLPERITRKILEVESGCWEWQGARNNQGYGQMHFEGKTASVHRVVFALSNGAIPDGEGYHGTCVLHRCDNRVCCNPEHLFLGSNKDNVHDMMLKDRQTLGYAAKPPVGEKNVNAKLTAEGVLLIRKLSAAGELGYVIAGKLGVNKTTVSRVLLGKTWRHV